MINLSQLEVWFVTGSQHLYGEDVLKTVAEHAKTIAQSFDKSDKIAIRISVKSVVTTPDDDLSFEPHPRHDKTKFSIAMC